MRAQIFSFDFVLAISLIAALFGIALYVSDLAANSINLAENSRDLKISGSRALALLIESSGNPSNWNQLEFKDANVKSLGLAHSRNVLDYEKTDFFFKKANDDPQSYELSKRILGLDLPGGNYSLSIYDSNKTILYSINPIIPEFASIYSSERIALLNSQPVRISLKLWVKK